MRTILEILVGLVVVVTFPVWGSVVFIVTLAVMLLSVLADIGHDSIENVLRSRRKRSADGK